MTFKMLGNRSNLRLTFFCLTLLPSLAHASFIEATIGTAVVNDATASYFNPAALVLMKNSQVIPQITGANFHSQFRGQSIPLVTGIPNVGNSSSDTRYYSPSLFLATKANDKIMVGLAIVTNSANRNADESSILRYVESSNSIQDLDVVPAMAIKINEFFSIGGGVNFSYANLDLRPITGFPGSNIPDSVSHNQSDGTGVGGNAGFLFKPNSQTVLGFNYRSRTTYHLNGTSVLESNPQVISNNYHYNTWSPARSVFSINHFVTKSLGLIATLQRIQWNVFSNIHVFGIANRIGTTPVILNGVVPQHLRNTWLATLGTHYRITPKWILRVAANYNQSPGNPNYQITNGDSIIVGFSTGYEINKTITVDGSYAHAFIKDENININGARFLINGINEGSRDSVTLKLTFNI